VHGFRSRTVYVEYSGQKLRRLGITFGRRGKNGSGRLLRAYDKGLQTRLAPARQWQRLELEFSGELAMHAFARLAGCPMAEPTTIPALVLGCIDFREPRTDGKRCARVADLPRCQWWADLLDLLGGTPDVIKPSARSTPDAYSRRRWRQRCVLTSVYRVANAAGVSPAEVLGLMGRVSRKSDRPLTPGEWQEVQLLRRAC
jgi:hypothetical protein